MNTRTHNSNLRRRKYRRPVPDGGWGWLVVAVTAFNNGTVVGFDICFPVIFLRLIDTLNASPDQIIWIVAFYRGIRSCVSPGASALCIKYGHRKVIIIGGLINAIGLVLFAFPISVIYQCFCWGVVCACACSMIQVGSIAMNGLYFQKRRARAIGIASCGISVGTSTLPLLMEFLLETYGYTGAILLAAALMLHICPFSFVFRPLSSASDLQPKEPSNQQDVCYHEKDDGYQQQHHPQQDVFGDHATDEADDTIKNIKPLEEKAILSLHKPNQENISTVAYSHPPKSQSIRGGCQTFFQSLNNMFGFTILRDVKILLFCLVLAFFAVAFTVTNAFLAGLITQYLSLKVKTVSIALALGSGCCLISRLLSGFIYDLQYVKDRILLFAFGHCAICGVTTFWIPLLATNEVSLYILWTLVIFNLGPYLGIYPAVLLTVVGGERFTSSLGVCRVFEGVGFFAGPIIAGALQEKTGTYAMPYYFAGGLLFICSVLAMAYSAFDTWKSNAHAASGSESAKQH